jgi:hypothetical protein
MYIIIKLRWPYQRLIETIWFFTNPRQRTAWSALGLILQTFIVAMAFLAGYRLPDMQLPKWHILGLLYISGLLIGFYIDIISDKQNRMWDEGNIQGLTSRVPETISWIIQQVQWFIIGLAIVVTMN